MRREDKLTNNWRSLQKNYPQLRGYQNPCYIMECLGCGLEFKTSNIDFVYCIDCGKKIQPFINLGAKK